VSSARCSFLGKAFVAGLGKGEGLPSFQVAKLAYSSGASMQHATAADGACFLNAGRRIPSGVHPVPFQFSVGETAASATYTLDGVALAETRSHMALMPYTH
jgi:hypothetical protein